jgi:hypothetical protein
MTVTQGWQNGIRPIRLHAALTAVFGPFACRPAAVFALWLFYGCVTHRSHGNVDFEGAFLCMGTEA